MSELADRQAELARALLAGGPVPEGFDAHRVTVEATALRAKRRGITEKFLPDVVEALDGRYRELFDAWAADHPRRTGVSFRADAAAFADWLTEQGYLPKPRRRWPFRRR
jgi:hypothetical protein